MEVQKQKGYFVLSMGRSGTNWVDSIANNTGSMGVAREWLAIYASAESLRHGAAERYFRKVIKRASTENGRFGIKVFPAHYLQVFDYFGFDFIRKCTQLHDVKILMLERKDRLAQSISMLRASQTGQWVFNGDTSKAERRGAPEYDFTELAQIYFHLERGYTFWRTYLDINQIPYEVFTYENLQKDPAPWFQAISQHLDVPMPEDYGSHLKIQRDALSEDWKARFRDDIKTHGLPHDTFSRPQPEATFKNAKDLFFGKTLTPNRYGWHN